LSDIDIDKYLQSGQIEHVTCGGESGNNARVCNYDWVLHIREQCIKNNVSFYFKQTGANFMKDGKIYKIERKYQLRQARKANIDF
jgi:protein gp37